MTHSGSIFLPITVTMTNTTGTNTSMISASTVSLRMASSTPPRNSTGIVTTLPESIDATHDRPPISCVARLSSAEVPMELNSSKLILLTRLNTVSRRSVQKPATTCALRYAPPSTVPRLMSATISIRPQQRSMYERSAR